MIQLLRAQEIDDTVRYAGKDESLIRITGVQIGRRIWQGLDHPNVGCARAGNDLGSFLKFMEQVGTTIFMVN